MLEIKKRDMPDALARYKAQPGAEYDGPHFTPVKEAIRRRLLEEQGHICAYCMQRIGIDTMKVEHWRPRTQFPELQLDHKNLLGCCMGNEGQRKSCQTCDTRKGDEHLKYSPANPDHRVESRICYLGNGKIQSDDPEFHDQIEGVLNLNHHRLKKNRESVLIELQGQLGKKPGRRSKAEIRKLLKWYRSTNVSGCLRPFAGALIYDLEKRLRKAN